MKSTLSKENIFKQMLKSFSKSSRLKMHIHTVHEKHKGYKIWARFFPLEDLVLPMPN